MTTSALLQTGPETFQVLAGPGVDRTVSLPAHARRSLGLEGIPPLIVATEIVRFLEERDDLPADGSSLVAVAGRYPGFVDELRSRLA